MRRLVAAAALALAVGAVVTSAAFADWDGDGISVVTNTGRGYTGLAGNATIRPDGLGYEFVLVSGYGLSVSWQIQRVTTEGAAGSAQWIQTNGSPVFGSECQIERSLASDGAGGAYLSGFDYANSDPILQHLTPGGLFEPTAVLQNLSGVSVEFTSVAPDGAGGVYVAWYAGGGLRLQRRTNVSTVAPGWNPYGRYVAQHVSSMVPALEYDGTGGVYVVWFPSGSVRVQHILADTTRAAGWPVNGLVLSPGVTSGLGWTPLTRILPSGPTHRIVTWVQWNPTSTEQWLMAQRFDLNGTLDPAWPAGGVRVLTTTADSKIDAVSDGQDGLHALWLKNGLPRWTHLTSGGTYAAGHDTSGVSPMDAAAVYGNSGGDYTAPLGTASRDGGLIFAWTDNRAARPGVRVRWLRSDGTPDPAEPDAGRTCGTAATYPTIKAFALAGDGHGTAYVAWQEPSGYLATDLWMGRLLPTPSVSAPPAARAALTLGAPQPNPARGETALRLALPGDAPAQVVVLDVSGRVRETRTVQGAGEHRVSLATAALEPGLYFVRVTQGSDRRVTRLVVSR